PSPVTLPSCLRHGFRVSFEFCRTSLTHRVRAYKSKILQEDEEALWIHLHRLEAPRQVACEFGGRKNVCVVCVPLVHEVAKDVIGMYRVSRQHEKVRRTTSK